MLELELMESAERIVKDVIGVSDADKVLVITDSAKLNVGKAFSLVCRGLGAETVLALMPLRGEHGNEPPGTIAAAMVAADVVFDGLHGFRSFRGFRFRAIRSCHRLALPSQAARND